jgi:16S rRNA processing protein RimM
VVALVRGLRGLRGQVRVELLTDRPEDRFAVGARLYLEGTPEVLTITDASPVADGPGWWLTFREIRDREAAEPLRDVYLEIDAPDEPREDGRWFFHELMGLAVRSGAGEELGTVVDIYRAGGAEVFVVRGPRGELDVPGVRGIVLDLAPDRGEMIVDLDALALDARPVDDEDYVRPRDRRPHKQPRKRPAGPAAPAGSGGATPAARPPRPHAHRSGEPASGGGAASSDGDPGT